MRLVECALVQFLLTLGDLAGGWSLGMVWVSSMLRLFIPPVPSLGGGGAIPAGLGHSPDFWQRRRVEERCDGLAEGRYCPCQTMAKCRRVESLGTRSVRSALSSDSDGTEAAPQEVAVDLDPNPLLPFQTH